MKIRPGVAADVPLITEWRTERAVWLSHKGHDQWGSAGLANDSFADRVTSSVEAGETWMLEKAGEPIATIAIDQWSDADLWTDEELSDALFLHRLISPPSSPHRDVAGPLLSHALDLATEQQKPWLRLDAWTSNSGLHAFWVRQGFEYLRTVPDRPSGALFRRAVFGGPCNQ